MTPSLAIQNVMNFVSSLTQPPYINHLVLLIKALSSSLLVCSTGEDFSCLGYFNNNNFRHLRQFGLMSDDPTIWWKAGLGVAAATVLGFVVLRTIQGVSSSSHF
uniref:Uncharacterized protein n=1 Tax=Glossina palpalis gambiensis TaxID=67801 RepID=A0A1B0BYD6_9MUSC